MDYYKYSIHSHRKILIFDEIIVFLILDGFDRKKYTNIQYEVIKRSPDYQIWAYDFSKFRKINLEDISNSICVLIKLFGSGLKHFAGGDIDLPPLRE